MRIRTSTAGLYRNRDPRRGGFVIIAVLMVVVVLSLAAYQYDDLMNAEARATERIRKTTEVKLVAQSGIHLSLALIADTQAFQGTLNSNPFDNPAAFQSVLVNESDNARSRSRCSLISLDLSNATGSLSVPMIFGMTDEGGKININALFSLDSSGNVLHNALMKLPEMTDEIAWSIVDWIDPDEEPNSGGAESQYYSSLTPPYQCKNAPLDTIEELLLVKGVTPALLFGNDRNRNGKLDPGEDDGFGGYNPGWAAFLTVYSRERNVDVDGAARVNLNGSDLNQLKTDITTALDADTAYLILAYRLFGSGTGGMMMGGTPGSLEQLKQVVDAALTAGTQPRQNISSIFSLVNARITIQVPSPIRNQPPISLIVTSPLQTDVSLQQTVLPVLLDKTTTQQGAEIAARINVNTAPREVLLTVPGMTEGFADIVVANRANYTNGSSPDPRFATIAWMLTDGTIPLAALQGMERYITARTQVYRIQSVGYFDEGGPIARMEAVIDANQGQPRIVYFRDLTDLGRAIDPRNLNR